MSPYLGEIPSNLLCLHGCFGPLTHGVTCSRPHRLFLCCLTSERYRQIHYIFATDSRRWLTTQLAAILSRDNPFVGLRIEHNINILTLMNYTNRITPIMQRDRTARV